MEEMKAIKKEMDEKNQNVLNEIKSLRNLKQSTNTK